jgi:hypothetical protein
MKMRLMILSVVALSASILTMNARAHDPSLHDEMQAPKSMPKATTCKQLADTEHYSADLTDPDIRTLKARCDAEKKAAAKAAAAKKSG